MNCNPNSLANAGRKDMKETKEHYFDRLDKMRDAALEVERLKEKTKAIEQDLNDLIMGPHGNDMKLVSSKTLVKWGEEYRLRKQ
jgi:hypothetical protein